MRSIQKIQDLFDEYQIRRIYVVDYPIAFSIGCYLPLKEIYASDRCLIGAHLHSLGQSPGLGQSLYLVCTTEPRLTSGLISVWAEPNLYHLHGRRFSTNATDAMRIWMVQKKRRNS
jgi:hypothetical protein